MAEQAGDARSLEDAAPFLPERVHIEGEVRVEPIDSRSCLRILDGVVEVRVPGIGRLIERVVVDRTVEAYGRAAELAARIEP